MKRTGNSLLIGFLLVLIGIYLLAAEFYPVLKIWRFIQLPWPAWLVAVGAGLLLIGVVNRTAGMAIPASILAGIGGILWYQNQTGDWASWAYLWALIPGFAGFGRILAGLLSGRLRRNLAGGLWQIVVSLVLTTVFGVLFRSDLIGTLWPVALIAIGLLILAQAFFRREPEQQQEQEG